MTLTPREKEDAFISELAKLRTAIAASEIETQKLKKSFLQLSEENAALEGKLTEDIDLVKVLLEENRGLKSELEKLKARLYDLEENLAEKNLTLKNILGKKSSSKGLGKILGR